MAAAAVAGLILGLIFGVAALLSAVLACASRSEVSESLPLHNLASTPPAASNAKKDDAAKQNQPKNAAAKPASGGADNKPAAKDNKDKPGANTNTKGGNEEWSGARLWKEYVAKAGDSANSPQYVVFEPKSGKIELKPAPANDAPFLKVHADGKVELVDGAGKQKGGGGVSDAAKQKDQPQQQQGQGGKGKDDKKQDGGDGGGGHEQKGKDGGKKDDKKDDKKDEKKDDKKDEKKNEQPAKQGGNNGQAKGKANDKFEDKDNNKNAEEKRPEPQISAKKDMPAAKPAANPDAAACCDAPMLSLHGTVELVQVLQALGVTPSATAEMKGKDKETAGHKHEPTPHRSSCKHDHGHDPSSTYQSKHRHMNHFLGNRTQHHHHPSRSIYRHASHYVHRKGCDCCNSCCDRDHVGRQCTSDFGRSRRDAELFLGRSDWETTSASTMASIDPHAHRHTCRHHRYR